MGCADEFHTYGRTLPVAPRMREGTTKSKRKTPPMSINDQRRAELLGPLAADAPPGEHAESLTNMPFSERHKRNQSKREGHCNNPRRNQSGTVQQIVISRRCCWSICRRWHGLHRETLHSVAACITRPFAICPHKFNVRVLTISISRPCWTFCVFIIAVAILAAAITCHFAIRGHPLFVFTSTITMIAPCRTISI